MRNLKKVLALVLAMAMSLSLAVTASASYNTFDDQAEIVNDEAVFLLNALGIVEGRENGDFDPAASISRAEATKLIACLNLNGVPVPEAAGAPTFDDVLTSNTSKWAIDYIEYCVAQGSVDGMGNNKFAPDLKVTGVQFAKMLLGVLGYDSAVEKYTGATWEYNVNTDAVDAKLYVGLEKVDMREPLSRDNAAQMMFNALKAKVVIYLTDTTGALEITNKTLMQDKYPTVYGGEGIMTAISYNTDKGEYTYTIGSGKDAVSLTTEADYTDMLGMNVMYVVDRVEGVLGFYAYENGAVVEGLVGDLDLTEDEFEDAAVVRFAPDNYYVDLTNTNVGNRHDYEEYKAIDNDDDGDYDYVIVYPMYFEVVTYVNSERVKTATGGGYYYFEDCTIYDGVAKDDAVVVKADTTLKTIWVMTEVAAQSGVINTVRADDGLVYEVVINGTTYDFCSHNEDECGMIPGPAHSWTGKTVDFYVINGYIADMEVNYSLSRDYLLVTSIDDDHNADGYSVQANVLFGDGTTDEITIASVDGEDGWDIISAILPYMEQLDVPVSEQIGYLARYEVADDGKYELTSTYALDQMVAAGVADLGFTATAANYDRVVPQYHAAQNNGEDGYITIGSKVIRIAEDALVFLVDQDGNEIEYSAVAGADIIHMTYPWTDVNYVGYELGDDGFNYATLIYLQTDLEFMSADITGIITSDPKFEANEDDEFVYFELYDGEETYTVYAEVHGPVLANLEAGDVITFRVDDGKLQMVQFVEGHVAAITGYSTTNYADLLLTFTRDKDDELPFTLADDAQVIFFDSEECEAATGEIAISADEEGVYFENIFFVADPDSNEITLLIVDPVTEGDIEICEEHNLI